MRSAIIILLLIISLNAGAQYSYDTLRAVKPRFWRASAELVITELIPWSFNRFARKAEFAKVSFRSIGNNLKPSSWEWDDNNFNTNQFAHPYHGNLYYSSFRTNGHSFWQSVPAAFAGSLLWEIAGETHKPAPNDFINTAFGGISLGEMTFRLSNKIVKNGSRGVKRQVQEVAALLVNPVNGLNRILDGNWGRRYADPDSAETLTTFLNIGMRRFNVKTGDENTKGNNELYLRLRLNYGDKFQVSNTPFNSFSAQLEGGGGDSTYLNNVQITGALKTWKLMENDRRIHLYSVTLNYDYIKNNAFEYGGQGLTLKLLSNWTKTKKTKILTEIGSGVVVLGAVQDNYLYYGEGRNYDYGPGISVMANVLINVHDKIEMELYYKGSRFETVNGNKSSFIVNTLTADIRATLARRFILAAGIGEFAKSGFYEDLKNASAVYPFLRLSAGYKF